jgi:hypothetical protein
MESLIGFVEFSGTMRFLSCCRLDVSVERSKYSKQNSHTSIFQLWDYLILCQYLSCEKDVLFMLTTCFEIEELPGSVFKSWRPC